MMMTLKNTREDRWIRGWILKKDQISRLSTTEQEIVAYGKYSFYRPENGNFAAEQEWHPVVG
jgi:hypothetical protein